MSEVRVQHPRAWPATIVLSIAAVVWTADKALPTLLMEPIKHAMSLDDTQIGAITGFTYAIAMALAGLPLAWLADRYDRVRLLAAAIGIWCVMTIGGGFARDFTTLFVCRIGVGIGEAALMPTALSLIGDLFPLRRVPRASAVFSYGATLGGFVAMTGGGALFEHFQAAASAGTLSLAPRDAWRWTMIAFGIIGLFVAMLIAFSVPEPRRHMVTRSSRIASARGQGLTAYLVQSLPFLMILTACLSFSMIFVNGYNGWLPPYFTRTYGWSIGKVGGILGTTMLVASLAAPIIGVFATQIARRHLGRDAPIAAICGMLALSLPFVVGGPLLSNGMLAAVAAGVAMAITGGCGIVISVIYISIAPSHLRARVMAVLLLIFGVIGSIGTIAYAGFTENVLHDPAKLYLTLSLLSGILIVCAIVTGIMADRRYPAMLERAHASEQSEV